MKNFERATKTNDQRALVEKKHEADYRKAAVEWVRSIITCDRDGRWFPFILNSIKFSNESIAEKANYFRRLAVIRACEFATATLTTRARRNPKRQDTNSAVRAIYLPAVKHGSVHLHGWLRVPKHDTVTARLVWKDTTFPCSADAPSSLVLFSTNICQRLATTNIWWNLDEDFQLGSVEYAQRMLKKEKREWGLLELQPAYLFSEQVA